MDYLINFFSIPNFPFTKNMGETLEGMKDLGAFELKIGNMIQQMQSNTEAVKELENLRMFLDDHKSKPKVYGFIIEQIEHFLKAGHFDLTKFGVTNESSF